MKDDTTPPSEDLPESESELVAIIVSTGVSGEDFALGAGSHPVAPALAELLVGRGLAERAPD